MNHSILWRRLDLPGHEFCSAEPVGSGWLIAGTAVFVYADEPCRLDYHVRCDPEWRTRSADVNGRVGSRDVELRIVVSADGGWTLNGSECPEVAGCIDIDLGFSPATNLLPVRRLSLQVGESSDVQAAWLPFPALLFELLPQSYRRTGEAIYEYESRGGAFMRTLQVNEFGFVTSYPGLWQVESAP